jgi:uncharacterized membrane protein YeaQ/YmgE (transglycosylase-associated protein family)
VALSTRFEPIAADAPDRVFPAHGSRGAEQLSILGWLTVGAIVGLIASKIMRLEAANYLGDIVLGVAGALVGGWLFFDEREVNELDLYSMLGALTGAAVVLAGYHAIRRIWCAFPRNDL